MDIEEEAPSGKRRRAATAAISRLEVIKDDKSPSRKLFRPKRLQRTCGNISLLASKMKPYFSKRTKPMSRSGRHDMESIFEETVQFLALERYGCPRLAETDLTRTTYPKRTMDSRGKTGC